MIGQHVGRADYRQNVRHTLRWKVVIEVTRGMA